MISLIWPYWQRQEVAERSCRLLAQHYADLDLELVIADDGNHTRFRPPHTPFPVKVIELPLKSAPMNPCLPINRAVEASSGDVIALSGPDMLHRTPILGEMRREVEKNERNYVIAAAWLPEKRVWHCHSSRKRPDIGDVGWMLPAGADYHFMTMMRRSLWDAAGGFDEDYRAGAGYDDPDFVLRLQRAGANFVRRDDLIVDHVRAGARANWTQPMYARNRAVFMEKWLPCRN